MTSSVLLRVEIGRRNLNAQDILMASTYIQKIVILSQEGTEMVVEVLIVILVLMLIGAFPAWPYSRNWGYYPTGGIGLILAVVVVLLLLHVF
jgi:hypothetical protein